MPHVSLISSTLPQHISSAVTTHDQFKEYVIHMTEDQTTTSLKAEAIAYAFQLLASDNALVSANCSLMSRNRSWLKSYEASLNLNYTNLVSSPNPQTWPVPGTSQQAIFKIDSSLDSAYNGIAPNISNYSFYWAITNKTLYVSGLNADGTGTCQFTEATGFNPQWATFLGVLEQDHLLIYTNQAANSSGGNSNYSALFVIDSSTVWNGDLSTMPALGVDFAFESKLQRWGNNSTAIPLQVAQNVTKPVDVDFDSVPP